jgi:hypothetical protein
VSVYTPSEFTKKVIYTNTSNQFSNFNSITIMLQDMNTRQLAEAIQEDLSKVTLILNYAQRRDVAPLMFTSCADLEGKHSCKTPLATLISNIDEASDLIIEKTYK